MLTLSGLVGLLFLHCFIAFWICAMVSVIVVICRLCLFLTMCMFLLCVFLSICLFWCVFYNNIINS